MKNTKKPDFSNEDFYIGIDVHKKSWQIAIQLDKNFLQSFSMDPDVQSLVKHMQKQYPNGIFHSVYEAGFSGFGIHEELIRSGFDNIVVSPGDIPITNKEKSNKNDTVDCKKLARELSNGSLKSIYIPDKYHQELRSLVRRREDLSDTQSQIKQKIKCCLMYHGIETPDELKYWSGNYINWLKARQFQYKAGSDNLSILIEELSMIKKLISTTLKSIRNECQSKPQIKKIIELLTTIPGIGIVTAVTIYTEIIDIKRFEKIDKLPSFVGLVPSISASGDKERNRGLIHRHNSHLRNLLIEAAWVAMRKDPALTYAYSQYKKRMVTQKAIIRIAKKLLFRIRHVWINETPYCLNIVE